MCSSDLALLTALRAGVAAAAARLERVRDELALVRAKVDKPMRPFHDGRHTSITNAAAAGVSPAALMARAGHSDFKTTQGYIDLAGETFREEAELADERMFGPADQKFGQKSGVD